MKLRLLSDWQHKSTQYKKGELLEVDDSIGELLVKTGIAQTETVQPQETKDVVKIGDGGTQTSQPINNLDDVRDVVVKTLAEVLKSDKSANSGRPPINVHESALDDPKRTYKGFGEFLTDVVTAGTPNNGIPKKLKTCLPMVEGKTAGSDEMTTVEGAFGGFLIPPAFREEILSKGVEQEIAVNNGAMVLPVSSTSLTIPALTDTTRTSTLYGGVTVTTQKERAQMTSSRPEFEQVKLEPGLVTGLAYVTDYLQHNYQAMGAWLSRVFTDAFTFKRNNLFIKGIGAGEPVGVINADCAYQQAKETGQAAATINTANVLKMRSHMRAQEFAGAVWLCSPDTLPQIMQMSIAVGTAGAPVMTFNLANPTQMMLLGRPIIFTEHCNAVGTAGDIVLVDWHQYLIGESTFQRADTSIHIRFDYNQTAFRFVQAFDGQPWWRATLTLNNSLEVSPIVTLATRS